MRLSDAGVRRQETKLIYPNHRPTPWLTEAAARDRSSRLLEVVAHDGMHGKTDHPNRKHQNNAAQQNCKVLHWDSTKKCPKTTLIRSKYNENEHQQEIRDKKNELNSASDLGSTTPNQAVCSETHCRRQECNANNCNQVVTEPGGHVRVEVKYRHRLSYGL
jgi:hypothetical protein